MTNTDQQLYQLQKKNVRIHSMYLSHRKEAKTYFDKLSTRNYYKPGTSQYIDISSGTAADQMTRFTVERALQIIGGLGGKVSGDALVQVYHDLLKKKLAK